MLPTTRRTLAIIISLLATTCFAEEQTNSKTNSSIFHANNQASIELQGANQAISRYYQDENHKNFEHGTPSSLQINLTKTFARVYTQLRLGMSTANLSYRNLNMLSPANSFALQTEARLGYSFYPAETTALTPYVMAGYHYWQLARGGLKVPLSLVDGATGFFEHAYYGLGLLSQWSLSPRWVLSADANYGINYHPWYRVNTYMPDAGVTIYQQANLAAKPFLGISLASDYLLTPALHGLLGLHYNKTTLGRGYDDRFSTEIPLQRQYDWSYSIGLGYSFGGKPAQLTPSYPTTSHLEAGYAANNQASLMLGYSYQNYAETALNQNGYLDRQQGGIPSLSMSLNKTFTKLYTQFNLSSAIGGTTYKGALQGDTYLVPFNTSTRNTFFDLSGRLGYMFASSASTITTPYLTLGYHRWLRDVAGIPFNGLLVNGYPETYQHSWYGVGLLQQFVVKPQWVLNLSGEYGRTFNASMFTWQPLSGGTIAGRFNLADRNYYQLQLGSDYCFAPHWHLLTQINYDRFNYGQSKVNKVGSLEPSSKTRLLSSRLGIGYSFS